MKLVIQIPCYNEEENLAGALDALPRKIEGISSIEVLIIDDGSSDAAFGSPETSSSEAHGTGRSRRRRRRWH